MARARSVSSALVAATLMIGISSTAAATTPPSGFVLQETITVPVTGSSVVSTTTLNTGVTYKIRASGTFIVGGPGFGDAEYAFDAANGSVSDNCLPLAPVDLGIGINDTVNDISKFPFWGAFNPAHVYTIDFVGLGAPISLNYHDCLYSDNSGSMTVEIFAPQAVAQIPTLNFWGLLALTLLLAGIGAFALRRMSP